MARSAGRRFADAAAACGDLSLFAGRAIRDAVRAPFEVRETLRQLHELGVRSVPLIPAGLALALVKETGPLTAGLLLAGRIGAGIGAELGAMKVTEQIDALEATAVDAFTYLVVTRLPMLPHSPKRNCTRSARDACSF